MRRSPASTRNTPAARQRPDVAAVCPKFVDWSQHLNSEYPGVDFNHMMMDKAQVMAIPLYAEPLFSKYFGTPYEQLDANSRKQMLYDKVRPCVTATEYRSQLAFAAVALQPAWYPNGMQPISPNRLLPALEQLKQDRAALSQLQSQINALPPTAASYDRVKDLEKSAAPALAHVWPSERAAFTTAANAQVTRFAAPALAEKVNSLVAQANGYDGALALKQAPQRYGDLWSSVGPEQQNAYRQQLDGKYEQIMKPLLAEEHSKMLSVTIGSQHLPEGAQWYSAFGAHYMQALDGPEVEQIAQQFRKRRDAQLAAAMPEVTRKVQLAKTTDAMNEIVAQCCSLPPDHAVPSFAHVQQIVDQRSAALAAHDQQVARSDAKRRALNSEYSQGDRTIEPDQQESAPAAHSRLSGLDRSSPDGGPSASEIYDALQSKLDQYNEQTRETQKQCANLNKDSPQDPLLGIQCLQSMLMKSQGSGYNQEAKITGLKRIGCSKAEGHVGYMCDYVASMSMNVPLPPSMKGLMEGGQITEARFVHMQSGWMMMPN